ncbi:ASC1-like protein isoform X1 [Musa acuminata AAA Group]|uniref:ASC1-like protein isoform X1 n=1 Tax=Musa acuminata AAA Group TaxID=214697 RepID=UPI0031DE74AA
MEYLILILNIMFFSISRHWLCSLYLEKFMEISVRKMKGEEKLTNLRNQHGRVFIFFQESLCSCLLHTVNHGLQSTRYLWIGPGDQVWPDQKIKQFTRMLLHSTHPPYLHYVLGNKTIRFRCVNAYHLATLVLIQPSYILSFAHVGSVVFARHEASDVFLEVGRWPSIMALNGLLTHHFFCLLHHGFYLGLRTIHSGSSEVQGQQEAQV